VRSPAHRALRLCTAAIVATLVSSSFADDDPPPLDSNFVPGFLSGGSELHEGARTAPLIEYRVRIDDTLQFFFRLVKEETGAPYLLHAGDELRVASTTPPLNWTLRVEPDGMLTVPRFGRFRAAGETVERLREAVTQEARKTIQEPDLQITAVSLFSPLQEFQSSISGLQAHGELAYMTRVSPDGTVQAPVILSMPAAGLSLREIEREAQARFDQILEGVHVTVLLQTRAPARVSVLGEVALAGQYPIDRPVSVSNAISLAGGWVNGADLKNVIVLRRDDRWRLIATSLDLRDDLHGLSVAHQHEIWLRDGDIVLLPKTSLKRFDDAVQLVFGEGLYKLFPFNPSVRFVHIQGQQDTPAIATPQTDPP
jgi:polysaccharide export outer membrane protein